MHDGSEDLKNSISSRVVPQLDRLIFHQFDPRHPVPGGIDTVIRGILRHGLRGDVGVVGVDLSGRQKLGVWTEIDLGGGRFYFMPVANLDPSDQNRKIPHSARLFAGAMRYRSRIPRVLRVDAHRADTAAALFAVVRAPLTYFIHTQRMGLSTGDSDSFWRRAGGVHRLLEGWAIRRAERVAVFNPDYAKDVRKINANTVSMSTWFDPEIVKPAAVRRPRSVVWVGRLEAPKDPLLAVEAIRMANQGSTDGWSLDVIGSGTLLDVVEDASRTIENVKVHGRLLPEEVAAIVGSSELFLMTSRPGYEGFPAVLVEAMAAGAVPVVTQGSDTAGLVVDGVSGFVTQHDAAQIARTLERARRIPREAVSSAVGHLAASQVISGLYNGTGL